MQSLKGLENEKGKRDASEALVSPNKNHTIHEPILCPWKNTVLMYITYQNN